MRTNAKTRKTMTEDWIEFFSAFKGKYCDDGFECCVSRPESGMERGFIQTATRRSQLVVRHWAKDHGYKDEIEFMDAFFGRTDYAPGIVTICCTMHDSGIYLYDRLECMKNGFMLEKDEKKRKNYGTLEYIGQNLYNRVPLQFCHKVTDLWDITKKKDIKRIFKVAAWQYNEMTKKDEYDTCMYDSINTWEDLPDWCLWKWQTHYGKTIEGREQTFEDYKAKIKSHASYVPTVKSAKEEQNNSKC